MSEKIKVKVFKMDNSPWVVHYNCGSCNGCDIELLAALCPTYDLERFGVVHVGNPKHADVLIVTGSANHRNSRVLKNVYDQMPNPKVVVAMGNCAATGNVFAGSYNILNGVETIVPVDAFVPGCPPSPEKLIDALVIATQILTQKRQGIKTPLGEKKTITLRPDPTKVKPVEVKKEQTNA